MPTAIFLAPRSFVPGYTGTDSRNAEPYDHHAPLQGGLSNAVGGPGFGRFCRTFVAHLIHR